MRKATAILSLIALAAIANTCAAQETTRERTVPAFELELEGGAVWQSRNDVQIPNDESGTRFSLIDLLGSGPFPAVRFYLTWNITDRHGIRLLLAPLSITGSDVLGSPVEFAGSSFESGIATEATYRFNSWRLTYRYRFWKGQRAEWRIGVTAKIRDAMIRLEQQDVSARKTDVGFVPLLNLNALVRFGSRWEFILDADALAGGPGRAEDVSLELRYIINDRWSISGGYRTVEGGADVDEVYNFAWFHYAVFAARLCL
jgi:hypothetical protein